MKVPVECAQMVHYYLLSLADNLDISPTTLCRQDTWAAEVAEVLIKEVLIAAAKRVCEDAVREVDENTGTS
jgi:hypothetical protein